MFLLLLCVIVSVLAAVEAGTSIRAIILHMYYSSTIFIGCNKMNVIKVVLSSEKTVAVDKKQCTPKVGNSPGIFGTGIQSVVLFNKYVNFCHTNVHNLSKQRYSYWP